METLQSRIESHLLRKIVDMKCNVGGSLSESRLLVTKEGTYYFLKLDGEKTGILPAEAHGLNELKHHSSFRIPQVIAVEDDFLITEYIEPGKPHGDFFSDFAQKLANMHRFQGNSFGWPATNFIGTSRQLNHIYQDQTWAHFFVHARIKPQITWLKQKEIWPKKLWELEEELFLTIFKSLTEVTDTSASLLHGDLWSGNFLCDRNNQCVLIDPACYFGHHEAELSIARLFGGFPQEFFDTYYKQLPKSPGYETRFKIYCLYHLLNHVNIFGSAYLLQTKQIISELLNSKAYM